MLRLRFALSCAVCACAWACAVAGANRGAAEDPPAINPFGPRTAEREDALPGVLLLSNGSEIRGSIYLTRDLRLKIFDQSLERQREVPLAVVAKVQAKVVKEWQEREWRFKENASDEKVYTGRSYPVREIEYTLTLRDGRKITGPLSTLVYVQPEEKSPQKFLLHKRQKGDLDQKLKDLIYVQEIDLARDAAAPAEKPDAVEPDAVEPDAVDPGDASSAPEPPLPG